MPYREITRAWEAFHREGVMSPMVRPAVQASWERSRQHAITYDRGAAPLVSEGDLHRRRSGSMHLLIAARPAIAEARNLLADARSMLILTDPAGTILETEGDARAVDTGQEVRLQRGGIWCEAEIGTNAIGTALASGKPVQIHACEHFCAPVQGWTCAAAPVRHPLDATVIGAVDISGSIETFNPQNLAHAVALAHQIEAILGRRIQMEHEQVLRHFLGKRSLWLSEEILVFGRSGELIYSTDRARKEASRRCGHLIADDRLSALGSVPPDAWAARLSALLPGASLEVVREEGEEIGGVVVLHASRRPRPVPRDMGREPQIASFDVVMGESPVLREVKDKARRMAQSGLPILLEGETGVGKEVFARAIHGVRTPAGAFVPLNCGGLPRELIASELFGYEKGAFTGADAAGKQGKVEAADGGLLCLDEIGEMPLDLQSYLLRVLEDGMVYRVGGHTGRRVEVRLVSMTNRDLSEEVTAGRFRKDLYYRIAALRLRIPPLRERGEDVQLLLDHFGRAAAARLGLPAPSFTHEVRAALGAYAWPGNVRELRNMVEMLVAMNQGGGIIALCDLPPDMRDPPPPSVSATGLKAVEDMAIRAAVEACGGNLSRAARRLGIARSTLYMRLAALEGRGA